ncbi:MAG: alpha/beta hydrolase [Bacteroidetes bacterium]|nr:alpha/beta hydrolase [Bacteroidota bacterium]
MKYLQFIIFCLSTLNSFSQVSKSPTNLFGNDPKHGNYIQNRGFKMYYEVYGQGEPLLMIHGNGGSISNFENQIPYFSKKYQVIIADSRAQGKSIDNNDSLSYEMMTDDLNALLEYLHKDSCYVIGWSDGGIEGLLLSIRHPEKVKKLAITGANLIPDPILSTDPWAADFIKYSIDYVNKLPPTKETKGELKLMNLMVKEPHITHADLQKIGCPTLVIGGDQDVIMPRHTLEIAENIKKSNLWILPNSGHSTPIFYKDLFNKTVSNFFTTPYSKKEKKQKFD